MVLYPGAVYLGAEGHSSGLPNGSYNFTRIDLDSGSLVGTFYDVSSKESPQHQIHSPGMASSHSFKPIFILIYFYHTAEEEEDMAGVG